MLEKNHVISTFSERNVVCHDELAMTSINYFIWEVGSRKRFDVIYETRVKVNLNTPKFKNTY